MSKIKKISSDKTQQQNLTITNQLKTDKKSGFRITSLFSSGRKKEKAAVSINFEGKRWATKKIVKQLIAKKINYFYFYTAIDNIFYILDHGIRPVKDKNLKENQKYIVGDYLEKDDFVALDLANTSRNDFGNGCLDNDIDLTRVAVFYIDLKKLYETTKKDGEIDNFSQRIIIKENIKITAILGILIKDFEIYKRLKQYLDSQESQIKLFFGENGNIKFGKELNNEKTQ